MKNLAFGINFEDRVTNHLYIDIGDTPDEIRRGFRDELEYDFDYFDVIFVISSMDGESPKIESCSVGTKCYEM